MGLNYQQEAQALENCAEEFAANADFSGFVTRSAPDDRPVHFVFQGGGVLGIAHLGFLRAMEHVGIYAAGVAGTSAGAILALLLVAARGSNHRGPVAEVLVDILWRMPASSFIDGPYSSRRLLKHVLGGTKPTTLELSMPMLGALRRLLRTMGLNKGRAFEDWLEGALMECEMHSMEQLETHLTVVARNLGLNAKPDQMLRIMAAALPRSRSRPVPIGIKFVFPKDMNIISADYRSLSPAVMARASMSIPFFFDPLLCDLQSVAWGRKVDGVLQMTMEPEALDTLKKCREVAFVDGGLLSNFPIDAFSEPATSDLPTIGVSLVSSGRVDDTGPKRGLGALARHVAAMVDGMRHVRDREAARVASELDPVNKLSNIRIAAVDVGSHNWLNFQLSDEEKMDLYLCGIRSAARFIRMFK